MLKSDVKPLMVDQWPVVSELHRLRDQIRYGRHPDSPALINQWLAKEEAILVSLPLATRRWHYEKQFYFLLDTISDVLLSAHWRCACLDSIHRPLYSFNRISVNEQHRRRARQLFYELSVSSHYLASTLTY